jgi:hypothetical protein
MIIAVTQKMALDKNILTSGRLIVFEKYKERIILYKAGSDRIRSETFCSSFGVFTSIIVYFILGITEYLKQN